jgi:hypothetical protein
MSDFGTEDLDTDPHTRGFQVLDGLEEMLVEGAQSYIVVVKLWIYVRAGIAFRR